MLRIRDGRVLISKWDLNITPLFPSCGEHSMKVFVLTDLQRNQECEAHRTVFLTGKMKNMFFYPES